MYIYMSMYGTVTKVYVYACICINYYVYIYIYVIPPINHYMHLGLDNRAIGTALFVFQNSVYTVDTSSCRSKLPTLYRWFQVILNMPETGHLSIPFAVISESRFVAKDLKKPLFFEV